MPIHLKYKLKYLESLMVEDKFGAHKEFDVTPFDLWKMIKEGREKEAYKLVSPKIQEYLGYVKKTELAEA